MKKVLIILIVLFSLCPTVFPVAADMAVTVAGAGDGSGTAGDGITLEWDNAMSLAQWEIDVEGVMEAGDRYFVEAGTYTLTGVWATTRPGAADHKNPIHIIGVKTGTTAEPPTTADYAFGDDRPLIAAGANSFSWEDEYLFRNLSVTSTFADGFEVDDYAMFVNCKSVNTKGVGDFYAFRVNDIITFIDCEAEASGGANGVGFSLTGNAPRAINCYAHNCTQSGIEVGTHYGLIQGCLVANNTDTGIWLRAEFGVTAVVNNTIYNSTVGLDITTVYQSTFYNNIISNCTTGALVDASDPSNFWDYNCYGNNTTDVTNITTGANSLLLTDPQFINPAGDDFRLKTSSPCLNTGLPFIGGSDSLFDGVSSMGGWQPWASPNPTSHRARYSGQSLYN